MDELLEARVKQLREIDDRLERIQKIRFDYDGAKVFQALHELRLEVLRMIHVAEAESAAF